MENLKPWYVTRYCLTNGIEEVLGEVCDRGPYVVHGSRSNGS